VTLREVADHFNARKQGKGYRANCPAHGDTSHDLAIDPGEGGRTLVQCKSRDCAVEDILGCVGLTISDLFPDEVRAEAPRVIVATYDYTDAAGAVLYQAVRYSPKDFRQRHANGSGWTWNMQGVRRVPYRLHDLQGQKTVYVVEGEKDADLLWSHGVPATTNIGGAGKWTADYVPLLVEAGVANVVVLPDNDPPGLTHGRQVADACTQAGLRVKLVPLPGLPLKGDVSDYLTAHPKADLAQVVRQAPLYDPARPVADPAPLALTSLADFLSTPDAAIDYVVEDRIPAGSVVLFVAPPKTGKSTATRSLALAVAQGVPWMGWRTTAGPVWVLALEDQPSEVKRHLRQMGATGHEALRLFCGPAPADLLATLHARARTERPRLIVIDHLGLVLRAKDFNDYAQITVQFAPLLALARETGAALVLTFHASAHQQREGLDAVLGSTAISASVDNVLVMKRQEHQRVLSSVQRIGPSLDPTLIELDAETGWFVTQGTKAQVEAHALGDRMIEVLRDEGWLGEATLHSRVEGQHQRKIGVLRKLLGMGWIVRIGSGKRGNPYLYGLPGNEQEPAGTSGTRNEGEGDRERESHTRTRMRNENAGTSKYVRTSTTPADVPSAAAAPLFDPKGWRDDTGGDS